MYNPTFVAERIKLIASQKNVSVKKMLDDCGINKNMLQTMQSRGSMPNAENLGKIADYLGCSVDYLLGRDERIQPTAEGDELDRELINLLLSLSPAEVQRAKDFVSGLKAAREDAASRPSSDRE